MDKKKNLGRPVWRGEGEDTGAYYVGMGRESTTARDKNKGIKPETSGICKMTSHLSIEGKGTRIESS